IGIQPRLLAGIEDANRARRGDHPGALRVERELIDPLERATDFLLRKAGSLQLVLERVAVRFGGGLQVSVEVVLEKIDENIEDAFLHFAAFSLAFGVGRTVRQGRIRCGSRARESTASRLPR